MKRKSPLPELLAPAGSEACLFAAIAAGADAVYLGLSDAGASNARTGAESFTRERLSALIPLAHAHGVKVYVTLNTLTTEQECAERVELAAFLYEIGADALIVADVGLATAIRAALPYMPLHASTQAFAHSLRTVNELSTLGFSRAVLARECKREDIALITDKANIETEIFLHGALCVSHSGQCLFSSVVGGRSGNRGACAQPCRLPYGGKYPLSLKDLSLARHVTELISDGVASLKIEGRVKSAAYVYGVTEIYRTLLDERRNATASEMARLEAIFSRDGFTDGYFVGNTAGMGGIRREEDKAASRALADPPPLSPLPLSLHASVRAGRKAQLSLSLTLKSGEVITVTAEGDVPLTAERAALTQENVNRKLAKLGGTGFYAQACTVELDEGLFLPVAALNSLRRRAVDALFEALRHHGQEECRTKVPVTDRPKALAAAPIRACRATPCAPPLRTAVFYQRELYLKTDTSLFDISFLPAVSLLEGWPKDVPLPRGVLLPAVIFDSEEKAQAEMLCRLATLGVRYALVSSLGALTLAKACALTPVADFRFNVANTANAALLRELGAAHIIASVEIPTAAAAALGAGTLVYGRIPLMLTERCFVKEAFGCGACGHAVLTDRRGVRFPVLREQGHRSLLFNSLPSYLGDLPVCSRLPHHHFIFSAETAKEVKEVLLAYKEGRPLPYPVRRALGG